MADTDSTKTTLSESELGLIAQDIAEVSRTIFALRNLATEVRHGWHDDANAVDAGLAGIIALAEKAGFVSDRCAESMGEISMCGSLEEWAGLSRSAPEVAGEAHHG